MHHLHSPLSAVVCGYLWEYNTPTNPNWLCLLLPLWYLLYNRVQLQCCLWHVRIFPQTELEEQTWDILMPWVIEWGWAGIRDWKMSFCLSWSRSDSDHITVCLNGHVSRASYSLLISVRKKEVSALSTSISIHAQSQAHLVSMVTDIE